MEKSKTKLYEFNPQVYPFRLWVGVKVPFEEATKFYNLLNMNEVAEFKEDDYYSHSKARLLVCLSFVKKIIGLAFYAVYGTQKQ